MKIVVDYDICASTGACCQIAPEVFEIRSDGYLYVLNESPDGANADLARQAADMCPTAAITIEE
jgi:ferredoxin